MCQIIQYRPAYSTAASTTPNALRFSHVRDPAAERLIAELEPMFDHVARIERQRQRHENMDADHHAQQRERAARSTCSPASICETREPGIERPGEHERHDAEINDVERHVGEREYAAIHGRIRGPPPVRPATVRPRPLSSCDRCRSALLLSMVTISLRLHTFAVTLSYQKLAAANGCSIHRALISRNSRVHSPAILCTDLLHADASLLAIPIRRPLA